MLPAIIGIVTLYFAAIYFRYEPIPELVQDQVNEPWLTVWDRFNGRVCVALRPQYGNQPGIACTSGEINALLAKQK